MTQVTQLEAALEAADAWDLTPQLFLWQPPVMAGLSIPPDMWKRADNHPAIVLEFLAQNWADIKTHLITQDPILFAAAPHAVVLSSEGWGLDMSAVADDPLKTAEYQRVADARRISVHPDRIEVRTVMGVHTSGAVTSATRIRGKAEAMTSVQETGSGIVSQALSQFLAWINRPATL